MKKVLTLTLLILLFVITVFLQTDSSEKRFLLKGSVKNQNSEVIAGAILYFKKDESRFRVVTDINGDFQTELTAGDYEITVNELLSKTFKKSIKIGEKGKKPKKVTFTINTNKNPCGLEENETCPKLLKIPKPVYPKAAVAANITGEVIVKVKINKEGQVITAIAENGHPLLKNTSILATQKAKFETDEIVEFREFQLTYVFLHSKDKKENLKRYTNLYRIVTFNDLVVIDID